jgi:hypothetical protein
MNLEPLVRALENIEQRLMADLAAEFSQHAYAALAPGNSNLWDSDGFYTARDTFELLEQGYPLPLGEQEFPVPADCPRWSTPCVDGTRILRGFVRHAWLAMPGGSSTGVVAMATGSTAPRIFASIDGCFLEPLDALSHANPTLLWRLGQADPHGMLHLHCDAPVVFSPQLGRVSCLVGQPFWYR